MERFAKAVAATLARGGVEATVIEAGDALSIRGARIALDVYALSYEAASFLGRRAVVKRTAQAIVAQLIGLDAIDDYQAARPRLRARVTTDARVDLRRLQALSVEGATALDQVARPLAGDLVIEALVELDDH